MKAENHSNPAHIEKCFIRLYWVMRIGIAAIWIWTAVISWFFFPHSESLHWLHRLGINDHASFVLISACIFDLMIGIVSGIFASRMLWQFQFAVVMLYSLAIIIWLPEFLIHPFGPIIKNISILACLVYLMMVEQRRDA